MARAPDLVCPADSYYASVPPQVDWSTWGAPLLPGAGQAARDGEEEL